ncbi:MAG: GNAT family N-acetyltransferase [Elainellaceae cyanobacterium]
MSVVKIYPLSPEDWPSVWGMVEPVFRSGETYAFSPDISETEARHVWSDVPMATYVAIAGDTVVGTYYIKPNQPGLGSHVCNCGYIVGGQSRGRGIATLMCEHSQREAVRLGFHAMQFNLVVSMNDTAVQLWQRLGFAIVGTLPGAFNHPRHGFVDALVMYKWLEPYRPELDQ